MMIFAKSRNRTISVLFIVILMLAISHNATCNIPSSSMKGGNEVNLNSEKTLTQVSVSLGIPTAKLLELLNIDPDTNLNSTIRELNIDQNQIDYATIRFRKELWGYSLNIVLIGMVVIFLSLSLTGIIVGQLRFIATKNLDKAAKQIIPKLDNVKYRDTSYNSVVAAITALHLHLQEAEESSKMTLAWSREPVSVWKTSSKFSMPNRAILGLKRR